MSKVIVAVPFGRSEFQYCESTISSDEELQAIYKSLYYCESRHSINKYVRGQKYQTSSCLDTLKSNAIVILYDRGVDYHFDTPFLVYVNGVFQKDVFINTLYVQSKKDSQERLKSLLEQLNESMLK